jgi:hypothetical protein
VELLICRYELLLIDNTFVGHAQLDPNSWEIQHTEATIREENIREYRSYLHELFGIGSKEIKCLDEINELSFNGNSILAGKKGNRTGQTILSDIMAEISRTRS